MPINTDNIGHMRRKSTGHLMRATSKNIKLWVPFTVDISKANGQADPALTSPVNFLLTFSDAPTCTNTQLQGFIALSGTANATTKSVTGTGTTRNVAISGMTGPGTVIINIAADQFQRDGGQYNEAATLTDNSIDFHGLFVTITKAPGQTGTDNNSNFPAYGPELNFTVTFSEDVSDFTAASCTKRNTMPGAVFTVTGNGSVYNVKVTGQTAVGWSQWKILAGACHNSYGGTNALTYSPALYWSIPQWRTIGSAGRTNYRGYGYDNPTSTRTNVNQNPASTSYPTSLSAARAAFAPYGSAASMSWWVAVGGAYNCPAAARSEVTLCGTSVRFGLTPFPVPITDARVTVTVNGSGPCEFGVFDSAPGPSQVLHGGTVVGTGVRSLSAYVDTINASAALSGSLYLTVGFDAPDSVSCACESMDQTMTCYSQSQMDAGGAYTFCGWWLMCGSAIGVPGETMYWLTGYDGSANSSNASISTFQVFY